MVSVDPSEITGLILDPVVTEMLNTSLTCVVFGLPEPSVTWSRFDLPAIPTGSSKFVTHMASSFVVTGGMEVQSTLQINSVDGNDTGTYTCTAVNQPLGVGSPESSTSSTVDLLVQSEFQDEGWLCSVTKCLFRLSFFS